MAETWNITKSREGRRERETNLGMLPPIFEGRRIRVIVMATNGDSEYARSESLRLELSLVG